MKQLNDEILFTISAPMKSAMCETKGKIYNKYESKVNKNIWYVADVENAADYIYCVVPHNRTGFCGGTIGFTLTDGTVEPQAGAWHSNSGDLFKETEIDIRDKCLTQGIVALERKSADSRDMFLEKYSKIIHYDKEPVIGEYERIKKIAQDYADANNVTVAYAYRSNGGGSQGWQKPKAKV